MPIFDQFLEIRARPLTIAATIEKMLPPEHQYVSMLPLGQVVTIQQDIACVYYLERTDHASTVVRLVVDTSSSVRAALQGTQPPQETPALTFSEAVIQSAAHHLAMLKHYAENLVSAPLPCTISSGIPESQTASSEAVVTR